MTLLESVVAFVLLAVVGVACLDLTRGATGLETKSAEWSRAVSVAESVMAGAAAGVPLDELASERVKVAQRSWNGGAGGVSAIEVVVLLPSGAEFKLSRLVRTQGATRAVANAMSAVR
ncbi:MAG: hypothetical protein ABIW79_05355 [Gemmatimonas sp.]